MGDSEKIGHALLSPGTFVADEAYLAPARRQGRAMEKQAKAQKEANKVSAAQQEAERQAAIRQQMRQERIRRAQIMSAAESSGVGGSSAALGTIGSGSTLAAAGQAFATGASMSARLQSDYLQQAADYSAEGQLAAARGQQWQGAIEIGTKVASAFSPGG